MKLKKVISGLFLLCLGFSPLVFADFIGYNGIYEFDIGERTQVGNFRYKFDQYGNLATDDGTIAGNVAISTWNNGPDYIYAYGWINGKLYGYAHNTRTQYTDELFVQGFVSNFCHSTVGVVDCIQANYDKTIDDVLNGLGSIEKVYFALPGNTPLYLNTNIELVFYDGTNYYGTRFNLSDGGPAGLTGSLGFDWTTFQNVIEYNRGPSPLAGLPSAEVITDPVCPTVGQVKANTDLVQDICYSGFPSDYNSGSTYIAGTGLSIKDVYELYSGGMSYQGWYDTYFEYYNHINDHLDIFEGHKELMGAFVSRQIFGRGKSSNEILNYCHLILDGLQDSMSCCVAQCTLNDLQITKEFSEDVLENLIGKISIISGSGDYTGDIIDVWSGQSSFWRSFSTKSGYPGILPFYIVIGFLGIVLLYILRR